MTDVANQTQNKHTWTQIERDAADQELLKRDALKRQICKVRYNIDDLKLRNLPIAQEIQVKFLDFILLMNNKIVTVCESTPENLIMYNQIQAEIQKYCDEEECATYEPM